MNLVFSNVIASVRGSSFDLCLSEIIICKLKGEVDIIVSKCLTCHNLSHNLSIMKGFVIVM